MIARHAAPRLVELAGYYPIIAITGPRQSGKTTLARATFADKPYASLEDPDVRALATGDPRGFLAQYPDGAIIDEVQRAPDLFSYLQTRVDADRRTGLFVLAGSQQFGLMERIRLAFHRPCHGSRVRLSAPSCQRRLFPAHAKRRS